MEAMPAGTASNGAWVMVREWCLEAVEMEGRAGEVMELECLVCWMLSLSFLSSCSIRGTVRKVGCSGHGLSRLRDNRHRMQGEGGCVETSKDVDASTQDS